MRVKLRVTKEDIANGIVGDETSCPIAIALVRELGEVTSMSVGEDGINFRLPNGHEFSLADDIPSKITKWVQTFDTGWLPIEEFETELEFEVTQ